MVQPVGGWFTGEDKCLRYALPTGIDANADWTLTWHLYPRYGTGAVIVKNSSAGEIIVVNVDGVPNRAIDVLINGGDTADLDSDAYSYVLARTDNGFKSVLNKGIHVLQAAPQGSQGGQTFHVSLHAGLTPAGGMG